MYIKYAVDFACEKCHFCHAKNKLPDQTGNSTGESEENSDEEEQM